MSFRDNGTCPVLSTPLHMSSVLLLYNFTDFFYLITNVFRAIDHCALIYCNNISKSLGYHMISPKKLSCDEINHWNFVKFKIKKTIGISLWFSNVHIFYVIRENLFFTAFYYIWKLKHVENMSRFYYKID
jgi:hypothetical protein